MEASLIQRKGIPYASIPAAGVHGVGMRALPGNLLQLARGVGASRRILGEFKPDVLLFTGGYIAAPMAVAAGRTPALLFVPDIQPGYALKFLSLFASCIAVSAENSRQYFSPSARVEVTGYPTRTELTAWKREQALQHFSLQPQKPVLLVSGGSKGARSINRAVLAVKEQLLIAAQIIHISGSLDWEEVQASHNALPQELQAHDHIFPYLHEDMGAALACADLIVCRAGASTLGELPLFGVPAILVPYPYAWKYQMVNADYLASQEAAIVVEDSQLSAELMPQVMNLLSDQPKLAIMRRAMAALAQPDAARRLAGLAIQIARQEGGRP